MGQYRVHLRVGVVGMAPEVLEEWCFGTLDALLADPAVVDADVAAALAAGEVEFDLQVRADDVPQAVGAGTAALARAAMPGPAPTVHHAEVDEVALPV
jgi:hypothetical protein